MTGCAGRNGVLARPSPEEDGVGLLFQQSFAHPDGKAVFTATEGERWAGAFGEYPLILANGRVLSHYLTGVQTRRSPTLLARELENFVQIHPYIAQRYRIRDGEWIEILSRRPLSGSGP